FDRQHRIAPDSIYGRHAQLDSAYRGEPGRLHSLADADVQSLQSRTLGSACDRAFSRETSVARMVRRASILCMRLLPTVSFLFIALSPFASAQQPAAVRVATSPEPTAPTVGVIDFYGLNKITRDRIRKTLGFKEGDPFPASKANVEERLDEIPGVVE